jgi:hypothetical protein
MSVFSSLWKKNLIFIVVSGVAGIVAIVDTQVYRRDLRRHVQLYFVVLWPI